MQKEYINSMIKMIENAKTIDDIKLYVNQVFDYMIENEKQAA